MSASNGISSAMKDFNADEFNLFPILPSTIRDSRCQAASCARGSSTIVPLANLVSVPSYQFQGWTISAHPEGNPYAHIKMSAGTGITMVTEAHIAEPGVADQLNAWLSLICNTLTEKHVHLPETSHLFLEIHNHSGSCNYYFADHNLRTVFWLHTLDAVGIQPQHSVTTNSHLQYALEENYWIHIGLFPDAAFQYSVRALNDLKVVFLHARADADTPTFPYTTRQREEIIDLLEHNKNRTHNSYITTYVAGLWTTVASHRLTHFGEDHCRLSFCRSTLEIQDSAGKWGILLAIISNTLLFGFPDGYQARFKSLWVDQLVNTSRWREHTSGTVEDLKQTVSSMLALIIANVHMMPLSSFPAFSSSSLLLCILGVVTALFLIQEQRRLLSTNAITAAVRLDNPNTRYLGHGRFRLIGIVHSLPQAMFTWALFLFAMQGFWMIFASLPLPVLLATFLSVAIALVVPCGGIWKALHPRPRTFQDPTQPVPIPSLIPAVDQIENFTAHANS